MIQAACQGPAATVIRSAPTRQSDAGCSGASNFPTEQFDKARLTDVGTYPRLAQLGTDLRVQREASPSPADTTTLRVTGSLVGGIGGHALTLIVSGRGVDASLEDGNGKPVAMDKERGRVFYSSPHSQLTEGTWRLPNGHALSVVHTVNTERVPQCVNGLSLSVKDGDNRGVSVSSSAPQQHGDYQVKRVESNSAGYRDQVSIAYRNGAPTRASLNQVLDGWAQSIDGDGVPRAGGFEDRVGEPSSHAFQEALFAPVPGNAMTGLAVLSARETLR